MSRILPALDRRRMIHDWAAQQDWVSLRHSSKVGLFEKESEWVCSTMSVTCCLCHLSNSLQLQHNDNTSFCRVIYINPVELFIRILHLFHLYPNLYLVSRNVDPDDNSGDPLGVSQCLLHCAFSWSTIDRSKNGIVWWCQGSLQCSCSRTVHNWFRTRNAHRSMDGMERRVR